MTSSFFFFFQAEDGIRDTSVTGVQTCALPIYIKLDVLEPFYNHPDYIRVMSQHLKAELEGFDYEIGKRRVGKECRSRWAPYH